MGSSAPGHFPAKRAANARARRPGFETLDHLPRPLEMAQFLRLAVGMARALGEVHKKELIHKDIKPAITLTDSQESWRCSPER